MDTMTASIDRQQELQLLSAVLDGDSHASRSFFNRYNCTIEMCVRKVLRTGNRPAQDEDVRDLVGEVWLSLLEDNKKPLRRFDPDREIRVSTWIGLLARNKAIDRLRGRHERTVSLEEPGNEEPPAEAPLPSEELGSADRSFLEAWYTDGREPETLAETFGISVGTVYSRRFKIQAKLSRSIRRLCKPTQRTLH